MRPLWGSMTAAPLPIPPICERQFATSVYETPNGWRVCATCQHEYPLTNDFFGSNCHYADCFDLHCKRCRWNKRKVGMKKRALLKVLSR